MTFELRPSSGIQKNRFQKLDLFLSPLESANLNYIQWLKLALSNGSNSVGASTPHLRMETDPVSEMSCCLEYQMIDEVQKISNP
jgi:hypothetical protein